MFRAGKSGHENRLVKLKVNSREVDLSMKLGSAGEAFFVERTREKSMRLDGQYLENVKLGNFKNSSEVGSVNVSMTLETDKLSEVKSSELFSPELHSETHLTTSNTILLENSQVATELSASDPSDGMVMNSGR